MESTFLQQNTKYAEAVRLTRYLDVVIQQSFKVFDKYEGKEKIFNVNDILSQIEHWVDTNTFVCKTDWGQVFCVFELDSVENI